MADTTHDMFGPPSTMIGQNTESTGRAQPRALRCDSEGRLLVNPVWGTGTTYYLDTENGNDANAGTPWSKAFKTMAVAAAALDPGDTLKGRGTITEEGVAFGTPNVQILNGGPTVNALVWQEPGAPLGSSLLSISAAGVLFGGVRFRGTTTASFSVSLGNGAHYATFRRCRFQGRAGGMGALIANEVSADNVEINDCQFLYFNTAEQGYAIWAPHSGGYTYSGWLIKDCRFLGNLVHIGLTAKSCTIGGCHLQHKGLGPDGAEITATTKIDLSGDGTGWNQVHGNYLGGTYSNAGGYTAGTNDEWIGNFIAGGLTTANPSA